ncbi:PAS domain-containing sensor histidine kinase [Allofranklinella schreckenbergeri]|uniref:histidine kinase n=1 Tax=Allofranklinella schreckenbergeri TaxID=1076744 RepID=A0A3M6QE22_9BURK|nr:ATP-binding protein [Allofranklinella schreckenbergeri]RMX01354.1 PAS domain-containing sensor histidine kinase [Allofranklinella schreckenbergeri]
MMWMNFVILQIVAVLATLWWSPSWLHLLAAALAAAWLWWLGWLWQGMHFHRWAREEGAAPRRFVGLWADLQYFWRKQQRKQQVRLERLSSSLDELRMAVQASPNGVVLLEADWHIAWLNRMSCEHFGLNPRDEGQNLLTLVRDPELASYCAVGDFREVLRMDGRSVSLSDMGRRRLAIQIFPYGEGGKRLLLSSDITHLQHADAMRRDFIANVSHEIRTPLTIFAGYVETLQTLPLEQAEREQYYARMQQQARRMQLLVEDLLMLSRLEGSPLPDLSECVDMTALLRGCRDEAQALSCALAPEADAPVHAVHLYYEDERGQRHDLSALDAAQPQAWPVMGQLAGVEKELHSAFANLVANAVRYTPAGGVIELLWRWRPDGSASFAVRDTGPGIAPEHLPRLAERFYRVDRSRSRETGGTGLGLAIVKHVAQRHGGDLRIQSTVGEGSCFQIDLPSTRLMTPAALAEAEAERQRKERLLQGR